MPEEQIPVKKLDENSQAKICETMDKLCSCTLQSKLRQTTYEDFTGINYIQEPVSYNEFFNKYLWPNKPCVFAPFITDGWRSRQQWVNPDGRPNGEFISSHFGDAEVPVANCAMEEFSSHPKQDMKVKEYMSYFSGTQSTKLFYLKDWHFVRVYPDYHAYTVPVYFQSDWLNEFWDKRGDVCDDYRFVYIGTKGTWTPFHADVFRSYSWSANVCGKKRWLLLPPGEEDKLKDKYGQLPFDITSEDTALQGKLSDCRVFEVIQEAGETIFVPSGWHHQVFNMEDTISINHNWINGCNIDLCWTYIKFCLEGVKREIEDCKEMEGWNDQCQLILRASSGINYKEFYNFIKIIAIKRIDKYENKQLQSRGKSKTDVFSGNTQDVGQGDTSVKTKPCLPDDSFLHFKSEISEHILKFEDTNIIHTVFDLFRIKLVLNDMLNNIDFKFLDMTNTDITPNDLLDKIDNLCINVSETSIKPS